ncbi:MAG: hypothetical protein LBS95_00130 [Mycoplasmataceae bacterium]|nr:hypothetical protein [Mycoplasmataceae bacterium]
MGAWIAPFLVACSCNKIPDKFPLNLCDLKTGDDLLGRTITFDENVVWNIHYDNFPLIGILNEENSNSMILFNFIANEIAYVVNNATTYPYRYGTWYWNNLDLSICSQVQLICMDVDGDDFLLIISLF